MNLRGDELVIIDIPRDNLEEAINRPEYDGNHTFVRVTDDDERREPWVFEIGSGGRTERIMRHRIYRNRIE